MTKSALPFVLLLLSTSLFGATSSRAAETDNYWAWREAPRDSTHLLERHLDKEMRRALDDVNAWPGAGDQQCHEVVDKLLVPFAYTGLWFFVGTMERWGLRYTPRTNRQYAEDYLPHSIYRYADRPLPGALLPLDPTTSVAGVHVGLDKIGHFLLNGRRYYDRYLDARERGLPEEEALVHAIELGLEQENGILGLGVSSIFSYADLEANYQGLELYRWLCEGEQPALRQVEGRWTLAQPLQLERFVNPCWDESFMPNAFNDVSGPGVRQALQEQCPLLDTPRVRDLRQHYRERGCQSFSHRYVMTLVDEGELPDPRPFDIERVCRDAAAR